MNKYRVEVFFEFLFFGIIVGVVEDLIAVTLVTGEMITWRIVGIVVAIAIPFAFLGEVLVDQVDFIKIWEKLFKDNNKQL